jgi:hypothetical protein
MRTIHARKLGVDESGYIRRKLRKKSRESNFFRKYIQVLIIG